MEREKESERVQERKNEREGVSYFKPEYQSCGHEDRVGRWERAWEEGGVQKMEKEHKELWMWGENVWKIKHSHGVSPSLSHTRCWLEPSADRQNNGKANCLTCFPSLLRWDWELAKWRGWKAAVTADDDWTWEIPVTGRARHTALTGPVH